MNIPETLAPLHRIGLQDHELSILKHDPPPPGLVTMRVIEVQRDRVVLHDGNAEHEAQVLPALWRTLATAQAPGQLVPGDSLAVGDWVLSGREPDGSLWVRQRLPPRNQIARRHRDESLLVRQVLVSNVDRVLIAMGLDSDFSTTRLERYLLLVQMAGVAAAVVLTKADLCPDVESRVARAQAVVGDDVPVLALDSLAEAGALARAALAPWLSPGQTLVLLGASGAGKSTLTNALVPSAPAGTGAVRDGDRRGRHTTTVRTMHLTPEGACIIDTPGLRTLRLDTDPQALERGFGDVAQLAAACRFRDCRHQGEPGCAVRDGVGEQRLKSFHKLVREAERDEQTVLERKTERGRWKATGRAVRAWMKEKRG
ncbi:MAG: ribosome small subunit-dependent GTPase A [Rubrivivax sp.]|nr:ribosome small subunit-dependent GTPase A [Rubrivivax sp.]